MGPPHAGPPVTAAGIRPRNLHYMSGLPGARTRNKDLEALWDDAKSRLKVHSPVDWHLLTVVDTAKFKQSIADLLSLIDS